MDDYNHRRFLRWASKTDSDGTFTPEAQAAVDAVQGRPLPTSLSPEVTIELLVIEGHLVEEPDGRYRRT